MAKNPRRQQKEAATTKAAPANYSASVSRRGRQVIGIGAGIVVLGFIILTRTDPAGQNWASTLSPLLLVLGYALIGIGIVLPDPAHTENSAIIPPQ